MIHCAAGRRSTHIGAHRAADRIFAFSQWMRLQLSVRAPHLVDKSAQVLRHGGLSLLHGGFNGAALRVAEHDDQPTSRLSTANSMLPICAGVTTLPATRTTKRSPRRVKDQFGRHARIGTAENNAAGVCLGTNSVRRA